MSELSTAVWKDQREEFFKNKPKDDPIVMALAVIDREIEVLEELRKDLRRIVAELPYGPHTNYDSISTALGKPHDLFEDYIEKLNVAFEKLSKIWVEGKKD